MGVFIPVPCNILESPPSVVTSGVSNLVAMGFFSDSDTEEEDPAAEPIPVPDAGGGGGRGGGTARLGTAGSADVPIQLSDDDGGDAPYL